MIFGHIAKAWVSGENPFPIEDNPEVVLLSQQEETKVLFDLQMCSCLLFNEDRKYAICAHCKSKNVNPGA